MNLPGFLTPILLSQYGEELTNKIISGLSCTRKTTLRVNTLKSAPESVCKALSDAGISCSTVSWNPTALIIENADEKSVRELDIYKNGEIYMQSLSSMIPPVIMEPMAGECILDMAAAPGGKTTQMAAISGGKAQITACEKNKIRADRLRYNIDRQGAKGVCVMVGDARKLDDFFSFDKILLDAPCSGSGTLYLDDGKLNERISEELIERSVKTQTVMLDKAAKLLKKGHEMVYSTCSILSCENEEVIEKALKKGKLKLVPIDRTKLAGVPFLPTSIDGTICVCPDEEYEGFFAAKLVKISN